MVRVLLGLETHTFYAMTSFENDTPQWLKNKDSGWITASMVCYQVLLQQEIKRATKGKQTGRTIEIQRLIGRSLRTVVDLKKLKVAS